MVWNDKQKKYVWPGTETNKKKELIFTDFGVKCPQCSKDIDWESISGSMPQCPFCGEIIDVEEYYS